VRDERAYSTPVFEILTRTSVSPKDGLEKRFTYIKAPEWVNVLALTEGGEVILVDQWRHGSQSFSLELPGGVREGSDSLEATARRELREETGYACDSLRELVSLNPNPALFGNRITTFLGKGARKEGPVSFDENEETEPRLVSVAELRRIYLAGGFSHALMAAAIGFFLASQAGQGP
jgi:8-oxo-dGTP pyrophosphatase MutT (NUDIX family)